MAINETAELERLIPSYELALCTIAGRLNDNNKYAMEAVLIGSHPSGKGVTAAIRCDARWGTAYALQEAPYSTYQDALSAFGVMLDDITARNGGRAKWKDEAWWEQHHDDLKARYGFEL